MRPKAIEQLQVLALDQELALVLLSRPKALEIKELLAAQLSKLRRSCANKALIIRQQDPIMIIFPLLLYTLKQVG